MLEQILKIEYETTGTNIDMLCAKYGIAKESLGWYIQKEDTPKPLMLIQDIPSKSIKTPMTISENDNILTDILEAKQLAVNWALTILKIEDEASVKTLQPKEVKDLVAILDTVEQSITKSKVPEATQFNVLVQNFMDKVKDDC